MANTKWELWNGDKTVRLDSGETGATSGTLSFTLPADYSDRYVNFKIWDDNPTTGCSLEKKWQVTCGCRGVSPNDFTIQGDVKRCLDGPCIDHPSTATTQYIVPYDPGECYKVKSVSVWNEYIEGKINPINYDQTYKLLSFTCNPADIVSPIEQFAIVNVNLEKNLDGSTQTKSLTINYTVKECPDPDPDQVPARYQRSANDGATVTKDITFIGSNDWKVATALTSGYDEAKVYAYDVSGHETETTLKLSDYIQAVKRNDGYGINVLYIYDSQEGKGFPAPTNESSFSPLQIEYTSKVKVILVNQNDGSTCIKFVDVEIVKEV